MKNKERQEAIILRQEKGLSINKIAEILNVSKSSTSLWLRDVQITDEQKVRLNQNTESLKKASEEWSKKCRKKRIQWKKLGRQTIRHLKADKDNSLCDISFICALFISEGSKVKNTVSFCNTDYRIVKMIFNTINNVFDIDKKKWKVKVNCYTDNGLTLEEIQEYWLSKLDLPKENMQKCTIKQKYYSSGNKNKNKHPYGVCTINLYRTDIVQQLYGMTKEIMGEDSERWID